jgi:type II secretory ATPase GspE/PulE/Tfp pilus assembly ATPase PilB-like protein
MTTLRQRFLDQRVNYVLISDIGYRDYMKLYDPPKVIEYHDISVSTFNNDAQTAMAQISTILEQIKADDMLAYLVQQAHHLNASDIHLESQIGYVRVRLRIDGVLHPVAKLSLEKYRTLISAIASVGNVSTASSEAQQGHIAQRVTMADGAVVDVNLRLETVPTVNGMDVVMRLFSMQADMYSLDRLGLSSAERAVVDDIISHPSGLVMVVGPTGSGKTTTLYSMLNSLNSNERKIITIEDPVEYQFEGVSQISVTTKSAGETGFADKLRAVLRLDPDIVMVGEIRDLDTAKTALQASLTGHLVLSTFHASSAAAALTRLMDVIGQNSLFVSAIRLVMAQRLVRRLDEATKQPYTPDEHTLAAIQRVIDTLPDGAERPKLEGLQLFRPGSSPECPFGYKGRVALREQFVMTGHIRELLEHPDGLLSAQDIEEAAVRSGMRTMLQNGILRVLAGETTLEEIARVVG